MHQQNSATEYYFHGDKATLFAQDSKVVIFPAGKDSKREDMDIPTPADAGRSRGQFSAGCQEQG